MCGNRHAFLLLKLWSWNQFGGGRLVPPWVRPFLWERTIKQLTLTNCLGTLGCMLAIAVAAATDCFVSPTPLPLVALRGGGQSTKSGTVHIRSCATQSATWSPAAFMQSSTFCIQFEDTNAEFCRQKGDF